MNVGAHLSVLVTVVFINLASLDSSYAKGLKDPCDVALGQDRTCEGEGCAFDPDVGLEGSWHRVSSCTQKLMGVWKRKGPEALVVAGDKQLPVADVVRNTIYRTMTQGRAGAVLASEPGKYVPVEDVIGPSLDFEEPVVRIAQLNDRGQAYNAMGQSGLARVLTGFAQLAEQGGYAEAESDRDAYLEIASASIETLLTKVEDGGLATVVPCHENPQLTCTWFHSVTRKDRDPDEGGTLNQDLHAIRDLVKIEEASQQNGWPANPALDAAIESGLNQLFLSPGHVAEGAPPNLADFLATPDGKSSWAYYGFNPTAEPGEGGYFLKRSGRNCSYHDHVLELASTILKNTERMDIAPLARVRALACDSPLRQMYLARVENVDAPSSAPFSVQWCAQRPGKDFRQRMRYLERAYSTCPK